MTLLIERAWHGQERLWKVFWIYGLLGSFVLQAVNASLALLLGFSVAGGAALPYLAWRILHPTIQGILIAYSLWVALVVWRCAFNVEKRFWGIIARGVVVLSVIAACVRLMFHLTP